MNRIRIKNFGPIKDGFRENDGWMDISKVTAFIGDQGAGKSTVAKLISMFLWIEKVLVRGDFSEEQIRKEITNYGGSLDYHRLLSYFSSRKDSSCHIEFQGNKFTFILEKGKFSFNSNDGKKYQLPQIMYVPAERNFISYLQSPSTLRLTSESLQEFLTSYELAKRELKNSAKLPINDVSLKYDDHGDSVYVVGDDYSINLIDASSGFQSLVPLYIVSEYYAKMVSKTNGQRTERMSNQERLRYKLMVQQINENTDTTPEQKRIEISAIAAKFNKEIFVNIVEEPEQNLFPESQWKLLKKLLEFNNMKDGNMLVMTTHSPYIIQYLGIAVQASHLKGKLKDAGKLESFSKKLYNIVPEKSLISQKDLSVYQLDSDTGTIQRILSPEGLPKDSNALNELLKQGNELFDQLLDIEEEI